MLLFCVALPVMTAGVAQSQDRSLFIRQAHVDVRIDGRGAVHVEERLTYNFSGTFTGAYRDIPLRRGEEIADFSVSEGGFVYRPGASARIGSSGSPGTFGVGRTRSGVRIVWHYFATDRERTFTIRYTLSNLLNFHDRGADLYLQVWGDEWDVLLKDLSARVVLPKAAGRIRVWGHPAAVRGGFQLLPGGRGATLRSFDLAPGQFAEIRVRFLQLL